MYCIPEKENSLAAYKDKYASLQQQYPEWTPHDLRVHTAQDLLPKFLADQETARRENLGLPVNDVPEAAFTMTDTGSVWYPNYGSGVGLVELSERSKKIMPDKYSPDEHATSLLIEAQFQDGATTVATSYGGRDVVIMEYDPITKEGKTTIINTAVLKEAQGKTIQAFMQEYFPQFASVFVTNNVFLFSDKTLSLTKAKEIVRPVLQGVATVTKMQFVQSNQQEYVPLPFLSHQLVDTKDVILEQSVPDAGSVPFEVKQEEKQQQITVFEQDVIHTHIEEEKKKILKKVEFEVEDQRILQQEITSEVTVLFQHKETHVQSEKIELIVPQPQYDRAPSESKIEESSATHVTVKEVQKVDITSQEAYVGDWQPSVQEFQTEVPQLVTDVSLPMQEIQPADVEAVQYEEGEKDVVVQQTLEEYFENCDTAETVVEIKSVDVRKLYIASTQEQSRVEEHEPKDVKIVRKLCWVVPLTITTEQPEMLEVEMPKDQNQRVYNLLHFLRKVVKQQFGEDTIRSRQTHAVRADIQETYIDEIEYYLSLLEQKNMRSHVFALVS